MSFWNRVAAGFREKVFFFFFFGWDTSGVAAASEWFGFKAAQLSLQSASKKKKKHN